MNTNPDNSQAFDSTEPDESDLAIADMLRAAGLGNKVAALHDLEAFLHFIELARRGRSSKASSGERVAFMLAAALHHIGDDIALLDAKAMLGAVAALTMAGGPWKTDADKAFVYRNLKLAGE